MYSRLDENDFGDRWAYRTGRIRGAGRGGRGRGNDEGRGHGHGHGEHHGHGQVGRGRFGFGRGGGGGRVFGPGDLRLVLLALVAEQPRYGYQLIKEIEQRFGGAYAPSPGSVYPTLTLLEEIGQIRASPSDTQKRLFEVTD